MSENDVDTFSTIRQHVVHCIAAQKSIPIRAAMWAESLVWQDHVASNKGTISVHAYVRGAQKALSVAAPEEEHVRVLDDEAVSEQVDATRVDDLLGADDADRARRQRTCPECKKQTLVAGTDQRRRADELSAAFWKCLECGKEVRISS